MPRLQLFRTLILRPLRRDLPRTTLTILAVALGVGVVIAIDLAGDAATGSFRSSLENLVGKTDLEIVANGSVDERWMATLAALPVNARFALLDIATAQRALHEYGKLDRIDVFVSANEDFTRVEREIRAVLPASYRIENPGTRSEQNQRMLRAFRWNLRVLSYISLVVGAFLIYNTISVSVVRRRAEIGVLRALGVGRHLVLWLFLAEALLFGL